MLRIVHNDLTDLFVGFNRQTGINNETTRNVGDKVTVIESAAGGVMYSNSTIKEELSQGESFSIPNWLGNASLR